MGKRERILEKEIQKTGKSMEATFDKIFSEIEKSLERKPKRRKIVSTKVHRRKLKQSSEEKSLKRAFAKHWKEVELMHNQHSENRKNMDRVLRKQYKNIMEKWRADLVQTKVLADQIQRDSKKLTEIVKSIPDVSQEGGRVARLHHHFRNSQKYISKLHRGQLREAYRELVKEEK